MTVCNRGDVVLVNFLFSDETGVKRRPAVVVSSDEYNRARNEAIIAAITSRTDRLFYGDHLIKDWRGAGLLRPSVATAILRTIKQDMAHVRLGILRGPDVAEIDAQLQNILCLH